MLTTFGRVYTPSNPFYTDNYQFGTQSLTFFADICSYLSGPAKQVIRDLDTLINNFCSNNLTFTEFSQGCNALTSACLTLAEPQALAAGAFVMTAKSSAEFWLEHASEFSNHTQHAISATDEKILKADASAAGKGLVTTLVTTQSITHAVTVAYFAGACVQSTRA